MTKEIDTSLIEKAEHLSIGIGIALMPIFYLLHASWRFIGGWGVGIFIGVLNLMALRILVFHLLLSLQKKEEQGRIKTFGLLMLLKFLALIGLLWLFIAVLSVNSLGFALGIGLVVLTLLFLPFMAFFQHGEETPTEISPNTSASTKEEEP